MVVLKNVSFSYHTAEHNSGVYDINLTIPSGQVVLFCGASGCGKTTVTRLINKLAPSYYSGELKGEVLIDGVDSSKTSLYELSKKIGSVFQNPRSQFFSVDSTSEIAFGCENTGVPREEMYRRIGQVADSLNIEHLLDRNLFALSGGEKQKIACASVAAMQPEIFILDEPSSNLDLHTICDLKEVIRKWKEQGKTVIIAEHRLYYLMELVDRIIYMENGRIVRDFPADEFKKIKEEELHQMGLRSGKLINFKIKENKYNAETFSFFNLSFSYGRQKFLDIPEIQVPYGAVVGILGYNGAGKSTLANSICGLERKTKGSLNYKGKTLTSKYWKNISYMVMQDVVHQLFANSVIEEFNIIDKKISTNTITDVLEEVNLSEYKNKHPLCLSGGQMQRLAVATGIFSNKDIMIFDEPTSGLDYANMIEISNLIKKISDNKIIFIITQDDEFLLHCCTKKINLDLP